MATGDSLADPFIWVDNSGLTVSGTTTIPVPTKYYRIRLQSGVLYTIKTTAPSNYDTFLYLYNTLGNGQVLITSDDDSNGGGLSLMTYTALEDGFYYVGIGGFGAAVGNYTINISPQIVRIYRKNSANKFASLEPVYHFIRSNNVFSILRLSLLRSNNRFASIQIREKKSNNLLSAFDLKKLRSSNLFTSIQNREMRSGGSEFRAWSKKGYELFADGVLIGFFAEGAFTLTDIALPDGDYDIVVKPLGNFYRDVEVRQKLRINIDAGGSGVTELFPLINNLTSIIDNTQTYIGWNILPQMVSNTTKIGLWFGATSGIIITGVPDVSISISELLSFKYRFRQTVSQWVAAACYDGAARGTKSEIELVWSTVLPDAPDFQHIEET